MFVVVTPGADAKAIMLAADASKKRWHFSATSLPPKGHWQGLNLSLPYRSEGGPGGDSRACLPASPFGANQQTMLSGCRFFTSPGDAGL